MQDKNVIKLTDQDAALLEQGASMLEGLENDERNRGNCSTAEGAGCSAHAVRRLASALLAHEREIGQCLHQIQEPAAAEQAAWHAGLDEGRAQAAPAAVAEYGSREERMVVLQRGHDGIPTVWCDPEIADIVGALNSGGVKTVASCSGHGEKPGGIALADGRQLLLLNSLDAFNSAISTLCPSASAPAAVATPDLQDMLRELRVQIHKITVQLAPTSDCSGVWMAHDKMSAALAATPAAVQTHAEAAAALCINSALTRIRAGNHAEAIEPLEHALHNLAATPAADAPYTSPTNQEIGKLAAEMLWIDLPADGNMMKFMRAFEALVLERAMTSTPAAAPVVLPEPAMNEEGYIPCPFCGSDQVSLSTGEKADGEPWYYVECESCTATAEPEKWNERALLATATGLPAQAVPAFCHVASLKLKSLQERGYQITGYALEKPVEGAQPERGFINHGGFVGWWWDGQSPQAQADAREFPAMEPELASLLGLMCFQCISFAQALRAGGYSIKKRAEDEQAAVLHWMLGHYFRSGPDGWRAAASADMERLRESAAKEGAQQG